MNYHFTIARDRVRVIRDNLLPIVWADIAPEVFHTYRVESIGDDFYAWYIDSELIDSGVSEGAFPSSSSVLQWRACFWYLASTTTWDFVRYGVPGIAHSGDYDSDGAVAAFDFYYFAECLADRGNGPGVPADPGCPWADLDADGDVDFHDFAFFQRAFTESR